MTDPDWRVEHTITDSAICEMRLPEWDIPLLLRQHGFKLANTAPGAFDLPKFEPEEGTTLECVFDALHMQRKYRQFTSLTAASAQSA
ncbi:hypothetical protein ACXHXM_34025